MKDDSSRALAILGQLVFVLGAAFLVYAFVAVTREGEARRRCAAPCLLRPEYMGANRTAPAFSLKDAQGRELGLDAFKGKVVVLNFWTRTCKPCMDEMPDLVELSRVLKDRPDAVVLTVSTDDNPSEALLDLKRALNGDTPPFPILFDGESKVVGGKYGTKLFPETWIIDKKGVIRARFDGPRNWSDAMVIEFIDQLRRGDYCPVEIEARERYSGKEAALCQSFVKS